MSTRHVEEDLETAPLFFPKIDAVLYTTCHSRMSGKVTRPRLTVAPPPFISAVNREGATFGVRYALEGVIGAGSVCKVHAARARDDTRALVAVKIMLKMQTSEEGLRAEIGVLRQIASEARRHYLLHFLECFEDSSTALIVTEYCPHGELYTLIKRSGVLDAETARRYLLQLCIATAWLHDHDIVHGDIKPENCLLDASMDLRLIDFGSVVRGGRAKHSGIGSPLYTAPEVRGSVYTPACDMWSIGVVLYVMLCGEFPTLEDARCSSSLESLDHGTAAQELVASLLHPDPVFRGDCAAVRRNAWMDWSRCVVAYHHAD